MTKGGPDEDKKKQESRESIYERILKDIRKKFAPLNIYVHRCNNNKCHGMGQMLHAQKCVLCNQNNYFYDETIIVDRQNDDIVRDLLIKL